MTTHDFITWLDGYIAGGGDDLERVKQQAAKITSVPFYPIQAMRTDANICSCPPGTVCGNVACPNLPVVTC